MNGCEKGIILKYLHYIYIYISHFVYLYSLIIRETIIPDMYLVKYSKQENTRSTIFIYFIYLILHF